MAKFKTLLNQVKAFVFDVDGVLAKTICLLDAKGDLNRTTSTRDGYALQLAVKKGYPVGIITGGTSQAVKSRLQFLGITDIYLGSIDKEDDFEDFMYKYNLEAGNIVYMGDDIPDFQAMKKAGVPTCPADAAPEIKNLAVYISNINGGEGCVRDIIEQVLKAQGNWEVNISDYKQ